ncbi:MAG: energy-coupling factor transporter ATPase [Negativicutes bacterium]|nr:energy-coupling factor transporter ATPase [Negativicutes bacterium]
MPIELIDVSYTYMPRTPFRREALRGISLTVGDGEFLAVIGRTGSGKSSLIQHFNGLLRPQRGRVTVDGVALHQNRAIDKLLRRKVGVVFQYPEHQLFAETVYEDIAFGPINHGLPAGEVEQRVRDAMRVVGLDFGEVARRSPFSLSGGQMRRVALAGVLAMRPQYLVLDEPSAGLDPAGRREILGKIYRLHRRHRLTVVLVTHNMEEVAALAERVMVMKDGRVVSDGSTRQVLVEQADRLPEWGLRPPGVVRIAAELRRRGWPLPTEVMTTGSLARAVVSICGRTDAE